MKAWKARPITTPMVSISTDLPCDHEEEQRNVDGGSDGGDAVDEAAVEAVREGAGQRDQEQLERGADEDGGQDVAGGHAEFLGGVDGHEDGEQCVEDVRADAAEGGGDEGAGFLGEDLLDGGLGLFAVGRRWP